MALPPSPNINMNMNMKIDNDHDNEECRMSIMTQQSVPTTLRDDEDFFSKNVNPVIHKKS